jgi:hypothetical protein
MDPDAGGLKSKNMWILRIRIPNTCASIQYIGKQCRIAHFLIEKCFSFIVHKYSKRFWVLDPDLKLIRI